MKHIVLLFSLFFCALASAQIVNIPDVEFKNGLIANGVDVNGDGEIQVSEAENQTEIVFLNNVLITDLTGIEAFVNLQKLKTNYNFLPTNVDLSSNINLVELEMTNSAITTINLSNNSALEIIDLTSNDITMLDVSTNLVLKHLDLSNNQNLNTLNVANNTALEFLSIAGGDFYTFDISNNIALKSINTSWNSFLDEIDYSNNTQLVNINNNNNSFENIDISNNPLVEYLDINRNNLQTINLSMNTALIGLDVSENNLSMLDVTNLGNLEILRANENQLNSCILTGTINLVELEVNENMLSSIDVSDSVLLDELRCDTNQITSLDLSANINMDTLSAENNLLSSVVVDNCVNLRRLEVANNQLTNIDVNNNVELTIVDVRNNLLASLDLSNLPNLGNSAATSAFKISNNPNLTYIALKNGDNSSYSTSDVNGNFSNLPSLEAVCVDDADSYITGLIQSQNAQAIVFTEYCSFVPGGDYNTITGNITYDSDNNGCDANDTDFPFVRINIDDGAATGATYTNPDGEYAFYTQGGNFTITPSLENPSFFNVTPVNTTINFPNNNNNIQIEDFCITANGIHNDVEIVIAPIFPARPGFDAQYLLTYKNKGNQTLSGNLSFQYDDTVLDFVTSTQMTTSQTVGQLTWDYSNLMPFESRSIYVTLSVNAPTDTPAVNIDDELNFTATVNPIASDDLPNDNIFNFNQTVVGAYDPNNIICIEGDVVDPSEIGSFLHYVVNFENTGNAPAENIVIEIEIDPTQYDINALYLLSSSHNAEVSIADNIVKIIFQSIYLASGGHGNILLKIPTQLSLQPQDFVTKNADIFFDYNFPIETNNAQTTFATLSNPEFEGDRSITMYPNPTKDNLYITADNPIKSIELYDVQGRIVKQEKYNKKQVNVTIANQAPGIYFIKISTEKGVNTEKIIKM